MVRAYTKRPERILDNLPDDWIFWPDGWIDWYCGYPNVWIGISIENDEVASERIPLLLEVPAEIKFVSAEPLLGPINFYYSLLGIDWVIVGGESGPGYRDINPEWARSIRDTCREFNTPFFMKQMSGNTKAKRELIPDDLMIREFPDAENS